MINKLTDNNELLIDKYIRQALSTQGELDSSRVVNGISLSGQDLIKLLDAQVSESEYVSYDVTDSFIVFYKEINSSSTNNVNMTLSDGSIDDYVAYKIRVIIYGNSSGLVLRKLQSRLLTEKVRDDLYEKGIFIERIDDIGTINEFINDVMWLRHDMNLYLSCRYNFSQLSTDYEPRVSDDIIIDSE